MNTWVWNPIVILKYQKSLMLLSHIFFPLLKSMNFSKLLIDIQKRKVHINTNSMLPYLSAYMGHENIYMTEEYLHLTYEQFSLITQKMEPFNSVIPKVGDYLG